VSCFKAPFLTRKEYLPMMAEHVYEKFRFKVEETYKVHFDTYTPEFHSIVTFFKGMGVVINMEKGEDAPIDYYTVSLTATEYKRFCGFVESL
jgi:hypothetical protein